MSSPALMDSMAELYFFSASAFAALDSSLLDAGTPAAEAPELDASSSSPPAPPAFFFFFFFCEDWMGCLHN